MSRLFRLQKDEKGQAIVEFALVFLIIMIIVLGIVQFSMILSAQIAVTNAAREGARQASLGAEKTTVRTVQITEDESITLQPVEKVVRDAIGGHKYLNLTGMKVTLSGNTIGSPVNVKVDNVYVVTIVPVPSFDNFSPGSSNIIDKNTNFKLDATAEMRLERKRVTE